MFNVFQKEQSDTHTFIVQGAAPQIIDKYVEEAGGHTLHQYKLIDALTAKLTMTQKQEIEAANPLLRFFEDTNVKINGFVVVKSLQRALVFQYSPPMAMK